METLTIFRTAHETEVVAEFVVDGQPCGTITLPKPVWNRFKKALETGAAPVAHDAPPLLSLKVVGVSATAATSDPLISTLGD